LKLESSRLIVSGMKKVGIDFVSSLPSTNLSPLVSDVMKDNEFTHVPVSNEGDSIGVCLGAYLAGKKPAFLAQNSGLSLATYQLLVSIHWFDGFPLLLVIDHGPGSFGDPSGVLFLGYGIQIPRMLDSFQVPYKLATDPETLEEDAVRAGRMAAGTRKPVALLLSGDRI
jgi:sulfopyruvate decarboxylase TPP-binding subunit